MITYTFPVEAVHAAAPRKGQTVNGYGTRIPVDCLVRLEGSPRWHRVYAIVKGNAASFYVRSKGRRLFIQTAALDALRQDWAVTA